MMAVVRRHANAATPQKQCTGSAAAEPLIHSGNTTYRQPNGTTPDPTRLNHRMVAFLRFNSSIALHTAVLMQTDRGWQPAHCCCNSLGGSGRS